MIFLFHSQTTLNLLVCFERLDFQCNGDAFTHSHSSKSLFCLFIQIFSKTNRIGVHNWLWRCAICAVRSYCRLHTFTINYVHPSGWSCSVAPQITIIVKIWCLYFMPCSIGGMGMALRSVQYFCWINYIFCWPFGILLV